MSCSAAQNTTAPVLLFEHTIQCLLYESCAIGGKPSTWFPPGGLVEQACILGALPLREGGGAKHSPPGNESDKSGEIIQKS